MPMGETVRAKAEELRTKFRTRIEEIRGGGSSSGHSPLLGNLGITKGPLVAEVREKGVITTARERLSKIRGGAPILGAGATEKVAVEKDTGALKIQRRRIAIEG